MTVWYIFSRRIYRPNNAFIAYNAGLVHIEYNFAYIYTL